MTRFEQDLEFISNGTFKTPTISYSGGTELDYISYQLHTAKFQLRILSSGMTMRGVKLKNIKEYYGFKGRTAIDMLPQIEELINKYSITSKSSNPLKTII